MQWDELIRTYGLVVLFVGTALEGEVVLLAAGYLAHEGYFSLASTIVVAFCGSFLSHQLVALLGRRLGPSVVARNPTWARQMASARALLHRWGALFFIGLRFVYGLRTVSLLMVGASGYSWRRILLFDALGGVLWAVTYGVAGYFFGHAAEALLGREKVYQKYVLLGLLTVGVALWLYHRLRPPRLPDEAVSEQD